MNISSTPRKPEFWAREPGSQVGRLVPFFKCKGYDPSGALFFCLNFVQDPDGLCKDCKDRWIARVKEGPQTGKKRDRSPSPSEKKELRKRFTRSLSCPPGR